MCCTGSGGFSEIASLVGFGKDTNNLYGMCSHACILRMEGGMAMTIMYDIR